MRFIFTSQGTSGSGSLANSLNLIESIYASHGHFPPDKHHSLNYQTEDLSHLLGHTMKGIYDKDLNTIFEFFEDSFPNNKSHGMVHTFTLSALDKLLPSIKSSSKIEIKLANIVRNPVDVFFSSRALINKSIKSSRYGKKEYLNAYKNILECNPLIFPILNQIELRDSENPFLAVEIVVAAQTIALMFNEASAFSDFIRSYKIEEILMSRKNFYLFLKETINFDGTIDDIPPEITTRVNIHKKRKNSHNLFAEELTLIDYFLNSNGKFLIDNFYPGNPFNFKKIESQGSTYPEELKSQNKLNNETLRNMRENLTLISTNESITKDIEFIKEKITSTLEVIDGFLLNNKEPNLESHQIWCKNVELVEENKAENKNIIKINNDLYVCPQSLGEIDPSNFSSKKEFLSHNPEIKELKD